MKKILIIEDDPDIVNLLSLHLKDFPALVITANDGEEGYNLAISQHPDLILLDIMLPLMDGIEVCKKIRQDQLTIPIIMLTAKSEEIDKIIGLEIGADDYMTKPFSVKELLARVKAIFRLRKMIASSFYTNKESHLEFGNLKIEIDKRKVMIDNVKVDLSPKEFGLLVLLASNPGRSYSRTQLLNLVWGYDFQGYEHTINSTINRLRIKIEMDMSDPKYILTTWGVGYRFNEEC